MNQHELIPDTLESLRMKNQLLIDLVEKRSRETFDTKQACEELINALTRANERIAELDAARRVDSATIERMNEVHKETCNALHKAEQRIKELNEDLAASEQANEDLCHGMNDLEKRIKELEA